MPHGYEHWPYSSTPPPADHRPAMAPDPQGMGYLSARLDHLLGWMERLTQSHEQHREKSEAHRAEVRERLARVEEQLKHAVPDKADKAAKAPSLKERAEAWMAIGKALLWAGAIALGAAKTLHWIEPETATRLAEALRRVPSP